MVRGFGSGGQFNVEWFEVWARGLDLRSNGSTFSSKVRFKAEWFEVSVLVQFKIECLEVWAAGLNLRSNGSRIKLQGLI